MARQRRGNRRLTRREKRQRRKQYMVLGVIAVVVAVGLGVAYAFLSEDELGEEFPDLGNRHLSAAPSTYIWNSHPPTSGPHSPNIAAWGIHDESVPEWNQVHNLEDGGVIVHYNCPEGCPEIVAELTDIVNDKGTQQLILHPYENMDSTIALTAWTRLLTLDEMDRGTIEDFIDKYRGIDHHK